ncbi:MAG: hypothetical protein DRJ49_05395 [Thermoprotei archaeon]|nr:MAG: hypothetical protein DRJ49_05395 [Thermoprotei archaeon]
MIVVSGELLPEAWERSIALLWRSGFRIYTEYEEYSIDSPMTIKVLKPYEEPRIHLKGIVVGKLSQLFDYVDEVLYGTNDWRVGKDWHYTYHERLFNYTVNGNTVNQIEYVVKKLKKVPCSRRAQAITWKPWKDINVDSPPCLQRVWFRIVEDKLILHVHLRSNDALKAAFMNMMAFTELQRIIAEKLGVEVGYYLHIADSYHVYERDWKWVKKFVEQIESGRSKRYWLTTESFAKLAKVKKS